MQKTDILWRVKKQNEKHIDKDWNGHNDMLSPEADSQTSSLIEFRLLYKSYNSHIMEHTAVL